MTKINIRSIEYYYIHFLLNTGTNFIEFEFTEVVVDTEVDFNLRLAGVNDLTMNC